MLSDLSQRFKKVRLLANNVSLMDKYQDFDDFSKDELRKLIFNEIMTNASDIKDKSLKNRQTYAITFCDLIQKLTPREFTKIIPIRKDFNGYKTSTKDYFTTVDFIDEIGWDNKIPNGFEFLMNYYQLDVLVFAVGLMDIVSDSRQRQTGKPLIQEFFEKEY